MKKRMVVIVGAAGIAVALALLLYPWLERRFKTDMDLICKKHAHRYTICYAFEPNR